MPHPGPVALGRGVVILAGEAVPPAWAEAPVVSIDEATLAAPGPTVASLHASWAARRPLVMELAVDPGLFRNPEAWPVEPWTLAPDHEPWFDRLHFLVWANTYDGRSGGLRWWWGVKAARLGGEETPDGVADILLPDGTPAWVDGGPRCALAGRDLEIESGGKTARVLIHSESVESGRLTVVPEPVAPTADLAPDQLAAVAHGAGPARVIAPAGSGKTRVLTERLRYLNRDRGYERRATLAVAYNVKARDEMVERTTDIQPRIQTLNGLAYGLLADHRGEAPPLVDEREVRHILDRLAPSRRPRANTDPIGPYIEALTSVRLGLRDPDDVEIERGDVPGFGEMFAPFRAELARQGTVDFDEQVYGAVETLLHDGPFRRRAQARHRHLLVDEFQDLTPAHVLLIRLLATPALDVFGVGDDDQCIYEHAGADPRFLIDFAHLFPGAESHPLEVNYRCPTEVVEAASTLLGYNRRRVAKTITPGPDADRTEESLRVRLDSPDSGAAAVVEEVQRWMGSDNGGRAVEPGQIAVLARVNSLLLPPHVALVAAGVPVTSILTPDVLTRTGLRAALAYLRLATNPSNLDPSDLGEVYRRPSRGLPNWITKWFRPGLDLAALEHIAVRIDDANVADKIEYLAEDIAGLIGVARTGSTREVLTAVKDDVGLGEAMELLDRSKGGEGSSQLDDLEGLIQVADLHPDPAGFEPWLRSLFHREGAEGGVTLSTIHRVKGREWDRVAVFGVTSGVLPHRLSVDIEAERRVLHVAITRGRHRVLVLGDASRPSSLLAELDGSAAQPAVARPAPAPTPRVVTPIPKADPRKGLTEPGQEEVYDALAAWRTKTAATMGKPAYVVLSNATVAAIAVKQPTTLAMLSRVPGIGPAKLDLYGEEILALLEDITAAPRQSR